MASDSDSDACVGLDGMDLDSGSTMNLSSEDSGENIEKRYSSAEKGKGRALSSQPEVSRSGTARPKSPERKTRKKSAPRTSKAERIIRRAQKEDEEMAMLRFRCAQVGCSDEWLRTKWQLTQLHSRSWRLRCSRRTPISAGKKTRCKMPVLDSTSLESVLRRDRTGQVRKAVRQKQVLSMRYQPLYLPRRMGRRYRAEACQLLLNMQNQRSPPSVTSRLRLKRAQKRNPRKPEAPEVHKHSRRTALPQHEKRR